MSPTLAIAAWMLLSLVVGIIVGTVIRRADRYNGEDN